MLPEHCPWPRSVVGELGESLRDEGAERLYLCERRRVRIGGGEHLVRRRARAQTGVEIRDGRGLRAGPTCHECRPWQPVECVEVLAREVNVEWPGRIRDDDL